MKFSKPILKWMLGAVAVSTLTAVCAVAQNASTSSKPNILFIMGDDIGWMQPSIYHRGLMVGETPNIDRIGNEGGIFMTYYAEQSCTAGRNSFFTGMHPLRTGMITAATSRQPVLPEARNPCAGLSSSAIWATTPANSARITSVITPMHCRPLTAFRNSGATSITWTRCRV